MFGPGMIEAINAWATVSGLIDLQEDFLYTADEIATEKAYAYGAGWSQDENGEWRDHDGDETEAPLDMLAQHNLPHDLQEEIVDACVQAFNDEYGD